MGRYLLNFAPREGEILAQFRKQTVRHSSPNVKFVQIDFSDWDPSVVTAFAPEVIIHTAAEASIDNCTLHPEYANKINFETTVQLAKIARELKARFIFTSSDVMVKKGIIPKRIRRHPSITMRNRK